MTPSELLEMIDKDEHMYDARHFSVLRKEIIADSNETSGVFKAFTYKDSLRFSVLFESAPAAEMIDRLAGGITRHMQTHARGVNLLWYSQIYGFSNALLERLDYSDPYHFLGFSAKNGDIDADIDMRGVVCRRCGADMIDACIDVLEDVFTPFPDAPGSFRADRERIAADFLSEAGGTLLFFWDGELIGFCGHKRGHITETVVRREFQGRGYGKIIVRTVLKEIRELGYDAELTTGHHNDRAIALYQKVGFKRIYESMRVTLLREK